jgi:hypothetical protein
MNTGWPYIDAGIDAGKLTPDGKNAEEMKKNLFDEDT